MRKQWMQFLRCANLYPVKSWNLYSVKRAQIPTSIRQLIVEDNHCWSTQANSHTIVPVQDDHLRNATSDHYFCPPNEKKILPKTTTKSIYPVKNEKQCI